MTVTIMIVTQTPLGIIPVGEGVSYGNQSFHTHYFPPLSGVTSQHSAIINIIFVDEDAQKFLGADNPLFMSDPFVHAYGQYLSPHFKV